MTATEKSCFHCLSPIPESLNITASIHGEPQSFCCYGCLGVAQWVNESGLSQYYQLRTGAPKADNIHTSQYESLDTPEIYQKHTVTQGDTKVIHLTVEGIHCAACMWLIEKSLLQHSGIQLAEGNATTFALTVHWHDDAIKLSTIFEQIAQLGYHPMLSRDNDEQAHHQTLRSRGLKRLGLAGLGMMQVMMYSAALYAGAWQGMESSMKALFQWVSFFVTTPVFFYSGMPFITSAVQAIKSRHLNMDVPVALAITLAYFFSVLHLFKGEGEIYFDSVVMFVFFLSASRYLEMMGRYKALMRTAKNTALLPDMVAKVAQADINATAEYISLDSLSVGDIIRVKAGESIAADGIVLVGESTVDESLLTGEARPMGKAPHSEVFAGSVNQEQTLLVAVSAVGQQTTLSETKRLLSQAQTKKPAIQALTDRLAGYIVAFILLSTTLSYVIWRWVLGADNAFEIALSVLVATCPCALSLAVPTAYAAASNMLASRRLFMKNNQAIDTLAKLSHVIFDKTGTLTTSEMQIIDSHALNKHTINDCLAIAAALEQPIHHPIAAAFSPYFRPEFTVTEHQIISGKGVSGRISGMTYTLGNADLIGEVTQQTLDNRGIYLSENTTIIAQFILSDEINATATTMVKGLQQGQSPLKLSIASGDSELRVRSVAEQLHISDYHAAQLPADKLALVNQHQQQNHKVLMVGDGINDAPVLAQADVSLAVGDASALSRSQADIVMMNSDLRNINQLLTISKKTHRIIWQNITWAICYNLLAVPFAILGYLPPWIAALGMSMSSLVVLGNALRIYLIK